MNFVKDKVTTQETYGLFIASGAVSPTEIAARSGFDWLLLDM
jgi:2-keto-3-deoxy-L-rhamnonate aldolase RhmA